MRFDKNKIGLVIASIFFSVGYLLILVAGYREYYYYEFIDSQREDLIARLYFLSHTTGFLFYPTIIVLSLITFYFLKKRELLLIPKQWIFWYAPILIVGILFYSGLIDFLVMLDMRLWRVGFGFIIITILIYFRLIKRKKQSTTKKKNHSWGGSRLIRSHLH